MTDAPLPTYRITFSQEGILIGAIELGADVETRLEDAVVAESLRAGVGIAEWGQIACYDVWFAAESNGEALPEGLGAPSSCALSPWRRWNGVTGPPTCCAT